VREHNSTIVFVNNRRAAERANKRHGLRRQLLRDNNAEAGCDLIVVVTQGGTTSYRNCVRLGFEVAYSKATVIKHWDKR